MTGQSLDTNMKGRAAESPLQRLIVYSFSPCSTLDVGLLFLVAAVVSLRCSADTFRYQYQNDVDYEFACRTNGRTTYQNMFISVFWHCS